MKGVQAYDCSKFHPDCPGVEVVDVGGFPHLWCGRCRVFANLQAVSIKYSEYALCCPSHDRGVTP